MPKVVDHAARRAEITDATAREIARVGLEGVGIRSIARAAGSTTGLLSYYFADKRELLLATFRDRTAHAVARVEGAARAGVPRLQTYLDNVLPVDDDAMLTWKVWLAFWGAAVGDPDLAAEQRRRYDAYTDRLSEALDEERTARRLRRGVDVDHEARRLITVIDGIAVQAVFAPDIWTPVAQLRVADEHLAGIRPARKD